MNTMLKSLVTAGGLAACSAVGMASSAKPVSALTPRSVTVDNARNVPVTLYLEGVEFDTRLGTVPPDLTTVLSLPEEAIEGHIRLIVHPEGGRDMAVPEGLAVIEGETLKLSVPTKDGEWVPPPPQATLSGSEEGTAILEAKNDSNGAIVVFLDRGPFDVRLGTVSAHENMVIKVPPSLTRGEESVDLFIHEEGGSDLKSKAFELTPGAHLRIRTPN